jgi:hypothetical protein
MKLAWLLLVLLTLNNRVHNDDHDNNNTSCPSGKAKTTMSGHSISITVVDHKFLALDSYCVNFTLFNNSADISHNVGRESQVLSRRDKNNSVTFGNLAYDTNYFVNIKMGKDMPLGCDDGIKVENLYVEEIFEVRTLRSPVPNVTFVNDDFFENENNIRSADWVAVAALINTNNAACHLVDSHNMPQYMKLDVEMFEGGGLVRNVAVLLARRPRMPRRNVTIRDSFLHKGGFFIKIHAVCPECASLAAEDLHLGIARVERGDFFIFTVSNTSGRSLFERTPGLNCAMERGRDTTHLDIQCSMFAEESFRVDSIYLWHKTRLVLFSDTIPHETRLIPAYHETDAAASRNNFIAIAIVIAIFKFFY